jgi:hypothetical protein
VLKQDDQIDQEFDGLLRKLITYMMEDARTISACIDLVFVAKAIERVGDHAKNLAEVIIYVVKGTDVRHAPLEMVKNAVRRSAEAPSNRQTVKLSEVAHERGAGGQTRAGDWPSHRICYSTLISMPMIRRLRLQRPVMLEPSQGQDPSPGRA